MSNTNKRSYTLYINSNDRINGNNNNANYIINWDDFLDRKYNTYKILWTFTSALDLYQDTSNIRNGSALVYVDFGSKSYSFNTSNKSSLKCIGFIYRDSQPNLTVPVNYFTATYLQNTEVMIDRPTQNFINIKIINSDDVITPLTTTDGIGIPSPDMSNYNMCIEFIPIEDSKI